MDNQKPIRVIAVTGGKGGIGKTNVSVNLALALAMQKQKVMLMDADLGLANIDVLLGLHPEKNLADVMEGNCELSDIILKGPMDIKIIPASSGTQTMTALNTQQHAGIIHAFSSLQDDIDVLLIDTAAGIADAVVSFTRAAQEVVVVVCNEPTSITDAYALIKVLSKQYQIHRFRILANMVSREQEARELFMKLLRATDRFLDVNLDLLGAIPYDEMLRKAVQQQKAVVQAYPSAKSSTAFKSIAQRILQWPLPVSSGNQITFFLERLIQVA